MKGSKKKKKMGCVTALAIPDTRFCFFLYLDSQCLQVKTLEVTKIGGIHTTSFLQLSILLHVSPIFIVHNFLVCVMLLLPYINHNLAVQPHSTSPSPSFSLGTC
ncbi:hypothetical protein P8452_32473 [Trifolium repens]|nr:hypothetical protein P8452_32473 [Trifolium repens]